MQTITRKFLVKTFPDLTNIEPVIYNRYYLYTRDSIVIRVQAVGNKFEIERKADKSRLIRNSKKIVISKEEFDALSKLSSKNISRESYLISDNPHITLRIYHGKYEGLKRAEVEFQSVEEAVKFESLQWFEKEITDSPLAKDGQLLALSDTEFKKLLE